MWYTYIIQSLKNNRYYIGSSSNVERRLKEHNLGKSKYTKATRPFKLVYTEEYETNILARQRELYLKRLKSRVYIEKLINEKWVSGSVVERLPDKKEVLGSIPSSPTAVERPDRIGEVPGSIPSSPTAVERPDRIGEVPGSIPGRPTEMDFSHKRSNLLWLKRKSPQLTLRLRRK